MAGNKEYFVKIDESMKSVLYIENNNIIHVCWIATMALLSLDSGLKYIDDIMYVPGFTHNLFSMG